MLTIRSFIHSACLLCALTAGVGGVVTADDPNTSVEQETELLFVLRSDAPGADKAIACKKLAIYGTDLSVPELAKLLPDPQLSSWARIALEAIPGSSADEALRKASGDLEGRLLVGTLNSIGVRRDLAAVDLLTKRLQDEDSAVASAAAVALGRIGNEGASEALQQALMDSPDSVRNAVAEGYVLCAERLHQQGDSEAAADIYDQIRTADLPMQRIVEATRGAILARNQGGIPLLMEAFRSPEKELFQLALGTAREFPGGQVDQALAGELARAEPSHAALILQAMADRPETVDRAAVLKAAQTGDKQVRLSAIDALRRVGDVDSLAILLAIAIEDDSDLAQAAKTTLAELPGEGVDTKVVSLLADAKGKHYPLLVELIGERRIDAVGDLVRALKDSDQSVRRAALAALGETVPLDKLSLLVTQVVAPEHPEDAEVASEALRAASIRMPDREACAAELATALQRSPDETKTLLLEILSEVGGGGALQTLAMAAKSDDPELQDAGSRLLGKWNGVDAAPVLMDLAQSAPAEKYQVRALRGYIGLVRKFAMPDAQRAKMCRQALKLSRRTDEQKLVLDVLELYPSVETLKVAIDAKQNPALIEDATASSLVIAKKLSAKGVDVSGLMSGSDQG